MITRPLASSLKLLIASLCCNFGTIIVRALEEIPSQSSHHDKIFTPLSCNYQLMTTECISFTSYFGTSFEFTTKVVIPCGKCIILDPLSDDYTSLSSAEYVFNDGLSIVGRLLIPNIGDHEGSTKIKLLTKSVEVEGILSIYEGVTAEYLDNNQRSVSGVPNLEIHLFGAQDGERYLIPHEENSHACEDEGGCKIGKLPFAVAGGRLDIHAMPKVIEGGGGTSDCPTWTDLIEIGTGGAPNPRSEFPLAPTLPTGCSGSTVLSFHSQSSTNWLQYWDVSSGAGTTQIDQEDSSLNISGRTKSTQGPRVKIYSPSTATAPCQQLQANVPYLLSARIKVSALDGYGPSSCQVNGKCLYLQLQKVGRYNKSVYRTIVPKYYPKTVDGEYFHFQAVFDVTEAELNDVNTYNGALYLVFLGIPAPGYDVNIQEFEYVTSPPELFPDPTNVCSNLIANGDFSSGQYYPWVPRSGGSFLIMQEEGSDNMYLRHAGRTSVYPGLEQTLVTDCLEKDLLYEFSMKVRVDTVTGGSLVIKLVITSSSGSVKYVDFLRPQKQYASDGWVAHSKIFSVTEQMATAIDVKLITMIGEGTPANTVDYDDVSIVFKQGVGQELLVDNPDVAKCWGEENELLITPSTNQYTDSTVVNVVAVSSRMHQGKEVGVISFEGDAGFHPTYTEPDPRTRAEVALLSRNVLVTASPDPANPLHGGHLIVMHTNVQQHLEGVQFLGFGQQGNLGRYPIHLHLCDNVSGSVIKSNAIIQSNQRCM